MISLSEFIFPDFQVARHPVYAYIIGLDKQNNIYKHTVILNSYRIRMCTKLQTITQQQ